MLGRLICNPIKCLWRSRLVRQTFDKINYAHMFQLFVSLKVLRKQCVQYTKMAIVCFAFGDASMWPGNQPESINYEKEILINRCNKNVRIQTLIHIVRMSKKSRPEKHTSNVQAVHPILFYHSWSRLHILCTMLIA